MRVGRQEDAHEFLRYLIDAMQQNLESNAGIKRGKASETTMIHRVFGGRLRSSVTCLKCGNRSDTVDPCLDISLDVQHASSVAKCFGSFTRPEKLSGANKYKCAHCRTLTDATKQLTISKTPSVLTLQLKRFCAFSSIKIAKFIEFPLILDLQKYVAADSKSEKNPCSYSLYAVLVHSGHSCKSGHYFCYVKSPSGVWYEMNDSLVRPVSVNTVLSQSAYLLFYEKMGPSKTQPPVQPIPAHIAEGKPAATTSTLVNNTPAATLLEDSVSTPVDISTVLTNQSTTPLTKKQKKLLRKLNKNKNKNKNKKKKKSSPSSISIPVSLGKTPTISNAGHWDVSSNSASDRDKILLKLFNEGSNQKVPDSWDVEYDRGKLKKVKSKKKRSMVRPSNPFQLASEIKGS
ncbi:Ubiquitin carboxyl-terminal hydrolase 36 [Zancudomyces culisetae]|uniref:ubiquitinyl hydrolase 1 n=1 Tax=Zancudomyces culisetae TaxID=1213189 RepID=A0A1R1PI86_ZANCU|nr:Ubiquitin carboxyl-terminal hydrolase 36 [Zancudomyces culisetae]OMH83719.1 Ubiquitin carboxyl-terminal hydrolase 36 [Zancudomyces culisetae]|eukprot:OMH80623.1 Ubiquitin carboxyl-terminal hydrolase 36 [Zancudomyces culisetae]